MTSILLKFKLKNKVFFSLNWTQYRLQLRPKIEFCLRNMQALATDPRAGRDTERARGKAFEEMVSLLFADMSLLLSLQTLKVAIFCKTVYYKFDCKWSASSSSTHIECVRTYSQSVVSIYIITANEETFNWFIYLFMRSASEKKHF